MQATLQDAKMLSCPHKPVGCPGEAGLLIALVVHEALLCFGTSCHASQTHAVVIRMQLGSCHLLGC